MKMPFGKHKGEDLDDVPVDYLRWLLANTDIDKRNPELAEEAQAQLDAREGRGILRRPRRCAVHDEQDDRRRRCPSGSEP